MEQNVSREEQIGFHKGALATLIKERQELARMLAIVDQLIQAHIKALEQLGVKIQTQTRQQDVQNTGSSETNDFSNLLK